MPLNDLKVSLYLLRSEWFLQTAHRVTRCVVRSRNLRAPVQNDHSIEIILPHGEVLRHLVWLRYFSENTFIAVNSFVIVSK